MTDRKVDNPPQGPFGKKPSTGSVYIDTVTGQFKQVSLNGPDIVIPVSGGGTPVPEAEDTGVRTTEVPKPATLQEAKQQYATLNKELAKVNKLLSRSAFGTEGGVIRDGNVSYTIASLQAQSRDLQSQVDTSSSFLKELEKPIEDAKSRIKKIDDRLNVSSDEAKAGAKPVSDAERKKLTAEKKKLQKTVDVAETKPQVTTQKAVAEKVPVKPKAGTGAGAVRMAQEGPKPQPTGTPGTPGTPKPNVPSAGGSGGGGAQPSGAPKNPKQGDTYTGPKGATFTYSGSKWVRTKPTAAQDWAPIVQQEFGSLWDVYTSNPDVKTVLDKAVQEGWFNDETKLTEALRNTSWFKTTERSARQFSIRQSTDPAQINDEIDAKTEELRQQALANGFTFDDSTLRTLATNQIKYGWSTQQTTNAVGSEAVAQAQAGGGRGMADLRSGYVGQNLRKIAQSYAQKPSEAMVDMWIQDIMTGKKTDVQWTETMRESAKTQFRSLQPALDKGQDVETALYAYKQQAQSILGNVTDVSEIDWTSDKWNKALNYRDEKTNEFRQMDLWEWNKYLRTLPEWQQTDEAKNTYSNVAYTLAQGFGKIA